MSELQHNKTIINQWIQDYQLLHDVLNAEQLALENRDFDALGVHSKEKDSLVKRINSHSLPPLINQHGVNVQTINDFKHNCLQDAQLSECWKALMSLVERCNFKNEVNGRLVQLLHQSCRRTFNLIKGFDPDNSIYNANGQSTPMQSFSDPLSA